jgi:hypothetical protein
MIFIIVRQLIKRILKEETEQDLSPAIKELLESSVTPKYKDTICQILVIPPWKRISFIDSNSEEYEIMVRMVGGIGSKKWPQTQFVHKERDNIVRDIWHTVYNYLGVSSSILIRNVISCEELMRESIIPNTLKRRANQQALKKYITNGEINYPTLCDDFEDAYEYADAVIDYAIDELLEEFDEDIYEEDYYSDVMDYLRKLCRDKFGEYLIDIYKITCVEEDINEGLHDTSWQNDEGDKVTLIDLLNATEDVPVKNISVDKIKSKLLTWDDDDKEIAKIEKSDLQYPILIFVDDNNNFVSIIDGHHRAQKAVRHKLKTIKAKLIPINSLPKDIKKVFNHLNKQEEKEGVGAYAAPAFEMKPDHVHFKHQYNESEITERCWKGYTQKGMKTMFGKKYPNCVKIKKKRVNESKMLDYLKQFLSGEVLDNYRQEKGRKEFQKMVDMAYKITAKDNPIEGMVGVLVGNIKKDMWGRNFNVDNDLGSRWDFTVVLKPLFTNYNPNNEPDYGERVLKFEEEFIRNARGMGFESISPVQHKKIKEYKVKYEWASRLDVKEI